MKARLLLFAFLFIYSNTFSQGNSGLIAHWDFNGNANDVSGNNLNGIVTGATLVAGYSNMPNTAYYFNGNGDHIDVPYDSIMNVDSAFAICTLIKPMGFYSGDAQGNFILDRGAEYAADYYQIGYCDNAYDSSDDVFSPNNEVFYSSIIGGNETPWYPGNILIDTNTWYCVTLSYTGDSVSLYIDGTKIKTLATHKDFVASTDGIAIGYYPTYVQDFPYWINAVVDDIRLYNRSLSDKEAAEYCDSLEGTDPTAVTQPVIGDEEVIIYPNPAHNFVTVQLPYNSETSNIQFFDALGRSVIEYKPANKVVNINIRSLPPGVYYVKITAGEQTYYKKIVKQ
ncbi:MAG TPA: T9SS type A sorting domain-containing protein [Candidatus Babeliaceae bacterium]|nr:T9SS type A sorting domain-containing protein [Candidatus Babeliaceae bacterium]